MFKRMGRRARQAKRGIALAWSLVGGYSIIGKLA